MLDKIDAGADIKNNNRTVKHIANTYVQTADGRADDQVAIPDYSNRWVNPNYYHGCGPDCTG